MDKIQMPAYQSSSRLIGGLPLLIIMFVDGNTGVDLLDVLIQYVAKLAG